MKLKFTHLTEAFVQTTPTAPFVVGGLQQQKGTTYVPSSAGQINTATPTITQPVSSNITAVSGQKSAQPPQLPQSGLIGRSSQTPSVLNIPEPTNITTPVASPDMMPVQPQAQPEPQTGAWGGQQPQGAAPVPPATPAPTPAPAKPAPSKPAAKPKKAATPDQGDKYQRVIDRYNRWAEIESAKANYLEQQKRASALRESFKFNRGYLKSLLSEEGGGGGAGGGGGSYGGRSSTPMDKAIEYVKNNLGLGPIGTLIGKGVKKGYEAGKGIVKDYVKPLAIEASPLLTPPKEAMASLTGRLSGLGYSERGIKDRMDYYKRLLGGSTQDPNTWSGAWKDEAAKLMTAALYDPRALSKLQ